MSLTSSRERRCWSCLNIIGLRFQGMRSLSICFWFHDGDDDGYAQTVRFSAQQSILLPSFHPSSRDSIIESIAPSALPIRSNRQTYGPRTELQYTTTLELNLTIRLGEFAQPSIQKSARHCVKSVGGMCGATWATKWIVTFYPFIVTFPPPSSRPHSERIEEEGIKEGWSGEERRWKNNGFWGRRLESVEGRTTMRQRDSVHSQHHPIIEWVNLFGDGCIGGSLVGLS